MHILGLVIAFIVAAYFIGTLLTGKGETEATPKETLQKGTQAISILVVVGIILFLLVFIIAIVAKQ
jgi:hypothetical protein